MSSAVRFDVDPSIDTYAAEFAEWDRSRAKLEPHWLTRARRASLARFAELGLPSKNEPGWREAQLAAIAGTAFHPIAVSPPIDLARVRAFLPFPGAPHLVFVGGHLIAGPGLSREDLILESVAEAVQERPEQIEADLSRGSGDEPDGLAALNGAFFKDGAYLQVSPGLEIREPIQLLFLSAANGTPVFEAPRSILKLGANSRATVLAIHAGLGGETEILTSARIDVVLGEGARLNLSQLSSATPNMHCFHRLTISNEGE